MADSSQTAIRVGDDILHSDALFGGIEGMLLGAAAGLLIGALVVSTGGLAGVALIAGAGLLGAGLGGKLGEIFGRHHSAGVKGKVLTGSPNVFIGCDKRPAARAEADVAHCEDHSDSEPALEQPGILGHQIAQGSEHVLINGHYAARKGDKGTCDFTLGDGWPTVVIGGPPKTVAGMKITSETASIDGLILGMTIAGGVLLAAPAVVGIIGEGFVAGLGWQAIGGQLVEGLVVPLARGIVFSKVFGEGLKDLGGRIWGQGSLGQELSEFTGEVGGGFAGGLGGPGEAGAGEAGASEAGASEAGIDEAGTQRYGGSGADPEITSTQAEQARANAAYDQIRANDDVAQIAQNTGHSPEQIQAVKDHLFNSQHDIFNPETGESAPGNFTPDEGISNLWNKAADGSLGQPRMNKWGDPIPGTENPGEVTDFNRLIAHEYVEQGLVSDGLPYQHPDSWVQDANGEWQYQPGPDNFGAHDLSPNFRDDPFSHYETTLGRSSEGIPRPNADNSNLDDVLAGIRRSLGREGGPSGGGGPEGSPGGGGGAGRPPGGGSAPEEPFTPARPLPPNPPEGRPVTPAPAAEPPAAPDAAPGSQPGTGTAPEPTVPLAENAPEAARPMPEPAPEAEAPSTRARSGRGRSAVSDDTLNGWARQYADNINSNRVWNWNENMDPQIPRSARAAIKQRAVDQGLIPNIPVNPSTTTPGFADFRGYIRNEVPMPEFLTRPDGTRTNLWRSTDDVQFRWLDEQVRQADPDFTNHGDEGYTWHHHEGGGIDEGADGPGRPDGQMQLVERGIHNATTHSGGRSDGRWADAPR